MWIWWHNILVNVLYFSGWLYQPLVLYSWCGFCFCTHCLHGRGAWSSTRKAKSHCLHVVPIAMRVLRLWTVFCLPYLQRCLLHVVAVVTMFQVSVPKTAMQIFVLSASVAIAEVSDEQDLVFLRSTCKFSFTEGWCFDVCRYFLKSNAIPKPLLQNAFWFLTYQP